MASSFELETLSESTDGMPIVITGTSTGSPTNVHVSSLSAGELDKVYLYANQIGTTESTLTIQLSDGSAIAVSTWDRGGRQGPAVVLDGHTIGDGITVSAYTSSSGSWVVFGEVHKVTNS